MRRLSHGVTLIELMVTIALVAILLMLAIPSFSDFRERNVARGVAEGVVTFVTESKLEAIKRNRPVRVTVVKTSESNWCLGASEAASGCDCAKDSAACSVGVYESSVEGRGARLIAVNGFSSGSFAFDPSRGTLSELASNGDLEIGSPTAAKKYQLKVEVNPLGRVTVCSSDRMVPGYEACK